MSQRGITSPTVEHVADWANYEHGAISMFEIGLSVKQFRGSNIEKDIAFPKSDHQQDKSSNNTEKKPTSETKLTSSCKVCHKGEHSIDKCSEFMKLDVKGRWNMAQRIHLCYSCLKRHSGPCSRKVACGENNCNRFHHTLLHKAGPTITSNTKEIISTISETKPGVILKMLPVKVKGPKGELEILAFLDEGSTVTMLDSMVAKLIGVEGPKVPLCYMWTGNISRHDEDSMQVSVEIRKASDDNSTVHKITHVHTTKDQLPKQTIDLKELYEKYPYTRQARLIDEVPKMLIGQDNCELIVSKSSVQPTSTSPMLTQTKLGWVIHGPAAGVTIDNVQIISVNLCCDEKLDELNNFVKKQWSLENFGVVVTNTDREKTEDDRKAIEIAEQSIKNKGNRYELGLPYKHNPTLMVDSYGTALHRLKCTERKIIRNNIEESM